MGFGEKLARLRKARDMSQMELAEAMDVSRQAVSKWEVGEFYPSTEKLMELAKIFDVSLDELVNGRERREETKEPKSEPETGPEPEAEPAEQTRTVSFSKRVIAVVCAVALLVVIATVAFLHNMEYERRDIVPMEELEHREVDISTTFFLK